MKLRIKGDSIRFRLLRGEVEALIEKGFLSEETRFSSDSAENFYYGLIASNEAAETEAKFEGGRIMVVLPRVVVENWANGDNVGIEASQNGLEILIEKDFACPGRPDDPDNADAF
jgi:hypothetical protein